MAMIGAIVLARRDVISIELEGTDSIRQNVIKNSTDNVLLDQSSD